MDNFDSYNVLLAIATNIRVTYDCFCAPGTHIFNGTEFICDYNEIKTLEIDN